MTNPPIIEWFKSFTATHWFGFISMTMLVVYIIVSDIPLAANQTKGDTYSEFIKALLHRYLIAQAFAGVVFGHWVIPGPIWLSAWQSLLALLVAALACIAIDIAAAYMHIAFVSYLLRHPQYGVFFFMGYGHLVWSQGTG